MKRPTGISPPRSVTAGLALLGLTGLARGAGAPQALFEGVTYAVEEGAATTIRAFDERSGQIRTVLAGAEFLPLDLAGYPVKDRLRRDLPTPGTQAGPASCVRLPGAGSIYRVAHGDSQSLLLVRSDGLPRILLTVPSARGLAEDVHVSADGLWVLAATAQTGDGDVYAVPTTPGTTPLVLTRGLGPLDPFPAPASASLRTNGSTAWFIADGELYRAAVAPGATAALVDLPGPEPVLPELVLASGSGAVVAFTEQPDGKRRVFLVHPQGAVESVSHDDHFHEYRLPSFDDPLGPFAAVSADGRFVAFRRGLDTPNELELYDSSASALDGLTEAPEFPAYIDSIGVLAFAQPDVLCFFAGDEHASPYDPALTIGAADMYAVQLGGAEPVFVNVTRTSGQVAAPFTQIATIALDRVLVGPNTERIFLLGPGPGPGGTRLSCFRIDGAGDPYEPNLQPLTGPIAIDPALAGSQLGLVLATAPVEPSPPYTQPPSRVTCTGDPAHEPVVRIVASDDADPFATDARVWFDGTVELGGTFVADAQSAGESKLASDTFVHVLGPAETLLQTVEFHTSCSQPLALGDRFGSALLVDAVGEGQPPNVPSDYCAYGPKPRLLLMSYTGDGCEATAHGQDPSKVECSGSPAAAPLVRIRASDKADLGDSSAKIWFDGDVALGETFHVDAFHAGESELKSDTHLHVFSDTGELLQYVKFHTSCSQPLQPLDQFGCARLLDCVLADPLDPADACAAGRPRSLTFAYLGEGCDALLFGPRLQTLAPLDGSPPPGAGLGARAATELPFTFPVGTRIDSLTASRDDLHLAFVTSSDEGHERAWVADLAVGTVSPARCEPATTARLGFTHSGALCVARRDESGTELLLLPRYGPAVTIDATGGEAYFLEP